MAGVWLVLVTFPASYLMSFVPAEGYLWVLITALAGLAQAWLLWIVLRGKRLSYL